MQVLIKQSPCCVIVMRKYIKQNYYNLVSPFKYSVFFNKQPEQPGTRHMQQKAGPTEHHMKL